MSCIRKITFENSTLANETNDSDYAKGLDSCLCNRTEENSGNNVESEGIREILTESTKNANSDNDKPDANDVNNSKFSVSFREIPKSKDRDRETDEREIHENPSHHSEDEFKTADLDGKQRCPPEEKKDPRESSEIKSKKALKEAKKGGSGDNCDVKCSEKNKTKEVDKNVKKENETRCSSGNNTKLTKKNNEKRLKNARTKKLDKGVDAKKDSKEQSKECDPIKVEREGGTGKCQDKNNSESTPSEERSYKLKIPYRDTDCIPEELFDSKYLLFSKSNRLSKYNSYVHETSEFFSVDTAYKYVSIGRDSKIE